MKRSDIATIATIALISMIAAYLLTSMFLGKSNSGIVKVDTMVPVTSEIAEPDPTVFNKDAINPTVEVIIGN